MTVSERLLLGLVCVFVLGTSAQWLAWRLKLPSILLLLIFGFLAGPATGLLDPDELLGKLLFPVVSIAVALILFEGGLTLRLRELTDAGHVLRNLLTVGAVVTWVLATASAWWLLQLSFAVSLLLGGILVVTGPTVIGPLLRDIRPVGRVRSILQWEGIVIDPIGAALAVLVFEVSLAHAPESVSAVTVAAGLGLARTLFFGLVFGAVAGWVTIGLLRRHWIPDYLHSPVAMMFVLIAFVASNQLQEESGLLAVTVMGVMLANQKSVIVHHIVEFKENLRVLLLSSLFILLAARLKLDELRSVGPQTLLFIASLILVVRPASVFLSTIGSGLTWQERVFLSWFAPRGIVAAAVASVFALRLGPDGDGLVQATFAVIIGTVTVYGLTAGILARWLGLATKDAQGALIVGAYAGARAIGHALKSAGFPVLMVDSSRENVHTARMEGLPSHFASILSEQAMNDMDLGGIGRLIALTSNDEVNSLAAIHFSELFGRSEVYQLVPKGERSPRTKTASHLLRGRQLFRRDMTSTALDERFSRGAIVKKTKLTEEFRYEQFREQYGEDAIPLFVMPSPDRLVICTADNDFAPKPGQTLISLVQPIDE